MTMAQLTVLLDQQDVIYCSLSESETSEVEKRWLSTFAMSVKEKSGGWIIDGFKWHGYTHEIEKSLKGAAALDAYLVQWPAPYLIFDEALSFCLKCKSEKYPDLSPLNSDLYVAHHNMKWSMAFTHEMPEIGPFFAAREPMNPEPG